MTLKELAEELGVSYTTVSRIYNGYQNFSVRPELREKVLKRLKEVHYSPDPMFRTLRKKDNREIAFLLPSSLLGLYNSILSEAFYQMEKTFSENGFHYQYTGYNNGERLGYTLPSWKAAGYVTADAYDAEHLAEVEKSGIPYLSLNGVSGANGTAVVTDDRYNMRLALDFLTGTGHRRIGYSDSLPHDLTGKLPFGKHRSVLERREAFLDFQKTTGSDAIPLPPENTDMAERTDFLVAQKATAIVAFHFGIALQILHRLREKGLRVPEDVSLICFNNEPYSELVEPAMTCIDIPMPEMGSRAAEILIKRCRKPEYRKGEEEIFRGKLIVRKSVKKR